MHGNLHNQGLSKWIVKNMLKANSLEDRSDVFFIVERVGKKAAVVLSAVIGVVFLALLLLLENVVLIVPGVISIGLIWFAKYMLCKILSERIYRVAVDSIKELSAKRWRDIYSGKVPYQEELPSMEAKLESSCRTLKNLQREFEGLCIAYTKANPATGERVLTGPGQIIVFNDFSRKVISFTSRSFQTEIRLLQGLQAELNVDCSKLIDKYKLHENEIGLFSIEFAKVYQEL